MKTPECLLRYADRLERYYAGARDNLSFVLFDGGHEFCPEGDVGIEWILKRL